MFKCYLNGSFIILKIHKYKNVVSWCDSRKIIQNAGVMVLVQPVKLLLCQHPTGMLAGVLAVLLPIKLPVNAPGKAAEHGPSF